jgi:phosphate transport system permease protein
MTGRRAVADRLATAWMIGSLAFAMVPLALILAFCTVRGLSALSLGFLTKTPPFSDDAFGGGYRTGIIGTLKLIVVSSAMAVPVGIFAAVYLNQYGAGSRFAATVRFVSDLMTGVPSVFIGVFVYSLIVEGRGYSAFSGAIALAILMLPIITRGAEEVLRLVPKDLREASLGLGAPLWRTQLSIILPAAASGLVTVSMLAVARAAGETAPLLFTSFGNQFATGVTDLSSPDAALPLLIFRGAGSPYEAARERAWAGALVLIGIVLVLTILARVIAGRGGLTRRS